MAPTTPFVTEDSDIVQQTEYAESIMVNNYKDFTESCTLLRKLVPTSHADTVQSHWPPELRSIALVTLVLAQIVTSLGQAFVLLYKGGGNDRLLQAIGYYPHIKRVCEIAQSLRKIVPSPPKETPGGYFDVKHSEHILVGFYDVV